MFPIRAEMIRLDCEKEEILLLDTKVGQAEGFVLYDLSKNDEIHLYHDGTSNFHHGTGSYTLKDMDNNGIIDSYISERWGLEVFYFPLSLCFKFTKGGVAEYIDGSMEIKEYPSTAEEVVKNFVFLNYLQEKELAVSIITPNPKVKGLDERIDMLSKSDLNSECSYEEKQVLENTALGVDPKLIFKSDVKGNTAVVTSEFSGDISSIYEEGYEEPLYTYYLVKENGKWRINTIK